jgi:hypothetical protein
VSPTPRVWPVDSGPTRNIPSRVDVGIDPETTLPTLENLLRATIRLTKMAALRTFPAGVARIDGDDFDACERGLVFDLRSQVKKRPAQALCPVCLPNRRPRIDALQLFDSNSALRVFGLPNDSLADLMVNVFCKPGFLQVAFLQQSLAAFGSNTLKFCAQATVALSQALDMRSAKRLAVIVSGESCNAEIDAKKAVRLVHWRLDHIHGGKEKPLAFAENQVRFALPVGEQNLFPRATNKRHLLPSVQRPDRNAVRSVGQDTVIESYRAVLVKRALNFLVELIGIGNFRNNPHRKLRRQVEPFTDNPVADFMEMELTKNLRIPGDMGTFVGSLIRSLKGGAKLRGLLCCWFQFQSDSQFHEALISRIALYLKKLSRSTGANSKFLSPQTRHDAGSGRSILLGKSR